MNAEIEKQIRDLLERATPRPWKLEGTEAGEFYQIIGPNDERLFEEPTGCSESGPWSTADAGEADLELVPLLVNYAEELLGPVAQPDGQPTYGLVRGALSLIEKAGIGWCYQEQGKPDPMPTKAFGRWKAAVEALRAVAAAMEGRPRSLEQMAAEPRKFLRP